MPNKMYSAYAPFGMLRHHTLTVVLNARNIVQNRMFNHCEIRN